MAGSRWQVADESVFLSNCPNHTTKNILFARIYTAGKGYAFSQTNQLILNLKIGVPTPSNRQCFREQAISIFADEVVALFNMSANRKNKYILTPMPPSKKENHKNFDDRIERVAKLVAERCENVSYIKLLRVSQNHEAAHLGGGRSSVAYRESMEIIPGVSLRSHPYGIIVLDDVLTSGAHYEAARQLLLAKYPDRMISGIFWAKAISSDPADDFDVVDP